MDQRPRRVGCGAAADRPALLYLKVDPEGITPTTTIEKLRGSR
ncbi:hypothetical protein [Prosthecodimorpha staleyi]|nr:hypothetical protein [Prosthecodimorpha staleyi]